MKNLVFLICIFAISTFTCKEQRKISTAALDSTVFLFPPTFQIMADDRVLEASGLYASRNFEGYLWSHNDSGDTARLLLISPQAKVIAEVYLEGVFAEDWEEISGYASEGKSYLIIGDIGDNNGVRSKLTLYKILEPTSLDSVQLISNSLIDRMIFTYPEGARDAEAFFYDVNTAQIVLISKREDKSLVYSFSWKTGENQIDASIGTLFSRNFTAADQSQDGAIIIKNYEALYYWPPSKNAASQRLIQEKPILLPYKIEPQGEAVCFDAQGNFFTLSEFNKNTDQKLYKYLKIK